jgi:hypothetical protein
MDRYLQTIRQIPSLETARTENTRKSLDGKIRFDINVSPINPELEKQGISGPKFNVTYIEEALRKAGIPSDAVEGIFERAPLFHDSTTILHFELQFSKVRKEQVEKLLKILVKDFPRLKMEAERETLPKARFQLYVLQEG